MRLVRRSVSVVVAASLTGMVWTGTAWAEPAWVQIEARPTLDQAQERARDWSTILPAVSGFAMSTGWYAIALGPYADEAEADSQLRVLRGERMIPPDSYVSNGSRFREQFWPAGAAPAPVAEPAAPVAVKPAPVEFPAAEAPAAETPAPVETLAESRRLEAALSAATRMEIQSALQWQGFYSSTIDGAFGRGTRASIGAWQQANGYEATGVLASAQQAQLLGAVAAERAALGLTAIDEPEAGIAIELPLGLIEFDHYDAPFVHYRAKDGSGVTVLLISQQGDQNSLFGLYDAMQTLEIVPMVGERKRERASFLLTGQNERIHSYTQVGLSGGLIKGFTLVYPADQADRMARVLEAMKASFRPQGKKALDATLGKPLAVERSALMAGLDQRHPEFARSGFFIAADGAVLTAAAGLQACGRITVEDHLADLAYADEALGLAVLRPQKPLAPAAVAAFQPAEPRPGGEIAVAGFSYPEALSAPVLSFGTLSDISGLSGEASRARLAVRTLAGDAGGPVLDTTGAVVGMLLPTEATPDKLLPEDLAQALRSFDIVARLTENGYAPAASEPSGSIAAEDIAALAQDMTVRVACWK
ncbi:serine protease [Sedimentimonas flavescens]|uniref:serine protease n=1 Tax=Sedimentimonas flavescens TaxID=2851012 RepID=UPI001C4A2FD2|nr:serine protease [Sedimentimonas flavescens]